MQTPPDDSKPKPEVLLPEDPTMSVRLGPGKVDTSAPTGTPASLGSQMGTLPPNPDSAGASALPTGDNFQLMRVIGRGGYGEIWQALQHSLGRTIAIKRMRPDLKQRMVDTPLEAAGLRHIFRQEALTTGRLEHPNIVPVYDLAEEEDGTPVLAMKLVRGESWDVLIRRDREMPVSDFLARHIPILVAMANAVAFAHSRGVVHRDIKPSQVMVGEFGEVVLMDWGLAVLFDPSLNVQEADEQTPGGFSNFTPTLDQASNPSGTPSYMAPEQTTHDATGIGPWTDVYLLGGTLYQLLTLSVPHDGNTTAKALAQASMGHFDPPQNRAPERRPPSELSELCSEAMRPHAFERLASVREFVARLEDWLTGAGRRRESRRITEEVAARFGKGDSSYEQLSACDGELERALGLWPENATAASLREKVVEAYARAAMSNGDLMLARVTARRLHEEETRRLVEHEVESAERRRARDSAQRRVALGAVAVLMLGLVGGGFLYHRAQTEVKEKERLATLLDSVNQLRHDEANLAIELAREIPLPVALPSPDGAAAGTAIDSGSVEDLFDRRKRLHAQRRELEGLLPPGKLESAPFELVLADANLRIANAENRDDLLEAYRLYSRAHGVFPAAPEPLQGMGIAAAFAGFPTSTTMHLRDAADRIAERKGARHPEHARMLALASEATRMVDEDDPNALELGREALPVLQREWVRQGIQLAKLEMNAGSVARSVDFATATLMLADPVMESDFSLWSEARRLQSTTKLQSGQVAEATAEAEEFYEALTAERGPDDMATIQAGVTYLSCLNDLGDFSKVEELARDLLSRNERADHPDVAASLFMKMALAHAVFRLGRFDEGEALGREAVADARVAYGPDSPSTIGLLANFGTILLGVGRNAEGEDLWREVLRARKKMYPEGNRSIGAVEMNLASSLAEQGRRVEAMPYYLSGLRNMRRYYGEEHPDVAVAYNNIAAALDLMDRQAEGTPLIARAVRAYLLTATDLGPMVGIMYHNVGDTIDELGLYADAETMLLASVYQFRSRLGPDSDQHPYVRRSTRTLCSFYFKRFQDGELKGREWTIDRYAWWGHLFDDYYMANRREMARQVLRRNRFLHQLNIDASGGKLPAFPFSDDIITQEERFPLLMRESGDFERADYEAWVLHTALLNKTLIPALGEEKAMHYTYRLLDQFDLHERYEQLPSPPENLLFFEGGEPPAYTDVIAWADSVVPVRMPEVIRPEYAMTFDEFGATEEATVRATSVVEKLTDRSDEVLAGLEAEFGTKYE